MKKGVGKATLVFLAALLFLLVSGCDVVGLSREDSGPVTKTGLQVDVSTTPIQPVTNRPTTVTAKVTLLGKPMTAAQVTMEIKQGAQTSPTSTVMHETQAGAYSGSVTFSNPGPWTVEVRAEDNGQVQTSTVHFEVK